MKAGILFVSCFSLIFTSQVLFAQESGTEGAGTPTKEYVKGTFENAWLINNQTTEVIHRHALDINIAHRFGVIKNSDDLFGVFAPANILLSIDYGVCKRFSIGLTTCKIGMQYDLDAKAQLLKQSTQGIPVSVTAIVNASRSSSDKANFINQDNEYFEINRYSYFAELMVARKFSNKFSAQVSANLSWFNIVAPLNEHQYIGASVIARYKISPQTSIIANYNMPLTQNEVPSPSTNGAAVEVKKFPKPDLGFGIEVSTGNHQFQIFVCTAEGLINQDIRVLNVNDFLEREVLLGFNITRQWGF